MINKPLIKINQVCYLNLVIVLLPVINFLVGINIDLYAPSLPAIATYYNVPVMLVKNTVTVTMLGFGIGCLFLGTLMDTYGRRPVILISLIIYILANLLTLISYNIEQLTILRFIQGFMVAAFSIGSRALIVDNFTGHRLIIAMVYSSVTYSLGPIIAPFIGGILQYNFGWKANFIAYAIFGFAITIMFVIFIAEGLKEKKELSFTNIITSYKTILSYKPFLAGVFIVGTIQLQQFIYPTMGAFIVESKLQQSSIIYGNSALLVGAGYLCGIIINRLCLKKYSLLALANFGFSLLILGTLLQLYFGIFATLNLFTLVLPFIIMMIGTGFLFANILSHCIKMFPDHAGTAIATLSGLIMSIAAVGIFIISQINTSTLINLGIIFIVIIALQLLIFHKTFKPAISNTI